MISYGKPCPGVILLQFRELADIWKISSLPFRGSYVCCKLQHEKKGNHCFARRTTPQVYSYANPCLCTMTLFARKMKSFPPAPCKLQELCVSSSNQSRISERRRASLGHQKREPTSQCHQRENCFHQTGDGLSPPAVPFSFILPERERGQKKKKRQ